MSHPEIIPQTGLPTPAPAPGVLTTPPTTRQRRVSQVDEERRINDWLKKRETGRFRPLLGTHQRRERNRLRREAEALQRRLARRPRRQRLGSEAVP